MLSTNLLKLAQKGKSVGKSVRTVERKNMEIADKIPNQKSRSEILLARKHARMIKRRCESILKWTDDVTKKNEPHNWVHELFIGMYGKEIKQLSNNFDG